MFMESNIVVKFFNSKIKPFISKHRFFFVGFILNTLIFWAALVCGFNSYKEFVKRYTPLTGYEKDVIIDTFPWAILISAVLYLVLFLFKKRKDTIFLGMTQYLFGIVFGVLLVNILFFSEGKYVLISTNLSMFYFVVFLTIMWVAFKLSLVPKVKMDNVLQDWLPPIIHRFWVKNRLKIRAYISYLRQNLFKVFIVAFMVLLTLCAFLLIFNAERAAEQLADMAYLLLVIGAGIEVHRVIKRGKV